MTLRIKGKKSSSLPIIGTIRNAASDHNSERRKTNNVVKKLRQCGKPATPNAIEMMRGK
jgi:hypothetical protein